MPDFCAVKKLDHNKKRARWGRWSHCWWGLRWMYQWELWVWYHEWGRIGEVVEDETEDIRLHSPLIEQLPVPRRHSARILTGLVLKPLRQMLQEAALSSLPKRSLEVRLLWDCSVQKKKKKKQRGRCEQIPRILNPQLFSPLRGSETDTNYRECAPLNSALSSSSNNRFWERPFKCLMWVINSYSIKQSCLQEWKTVIPLHGWQAIFLCQGLFLHI